MSTDVCEFSWEDADMAALESVGHVADRAVERKPDKPIFTWYQCPHCCQVHWCLPAAEAMGTAPTFDQAVAAGFAAARAVGLGKDQPTDVYSPHWGGPPA